MRTGWTIAAALAASLASLPAQAQAPSISCNAALVGTWLTTIQNAAGDYASRSLLTIHADGTMVSADSAQHQGMQGSSFSAQHGASAAATTMNFGFPNRESIARSDWTLAHDGKALKGTIALHIFPGVKGVDPFRADTKPVDTFYFTAQRVSAPY
jgi:hypothetical protein